MHKKYYKTIEKNAQGIYKEKGSKFLSFSFPVSSKDEIKEHLERLKSKYFDARHHCYAYILGNLGEEQRMNDDGEPNHSAGDSILRSIKSKGLTNTLVVVVRYFGGTKLGIRGLINAYYDAAEDAIKSSQIKKVEIAEQVSISYSYENTSEVIQLVEKFNVKISKQDFKEKCYLEGDVLLVLKDEMQSKLEELRQQGRILSFNITSFQ